MDIHGNAMVVGGAASETLAECEAVATNSQFKGSVWEVDITQETSVATLFTEYAKIFGRIDYCVNSAGIGAQEATDISSLSLAEFRRFLDINANGMFLVTKQASIVMREQEAMLVSASQSTRGVTRGAIVNLGSGSSLVATPGVLPYTTSKHAALGLTKNSALDNAPHGIRVNCVCPSWTATPMVTRAMEGVEGLSEFIKKAVPIGRIAAPEEVADAVVFLCSPRSSYITGSAMIVDGGTTLTASR
ncbi:NAD(P)-binding protein [Xylariaceae sp. FL0016]|nr:NAD(P)-binding protein [Xylariaceae sp. FL0016]